jgi:PBSX family phage terminase large subunit
MINTDENIRVNRIQVRINDLKKTLEKKKEADAHKSGNQGFEFKPFSDKQKKVLTWWCPQSPVKDANGIVADGSIRSGKTLSMSLSFVLWAMNFYDAQNFAMCGKTIGSFRRNVIFWLKIMVASRGYTITERRTDNLLIVKKNKTVNYFYIFGGKDERSQDLIQGLTLAGCFFDEVALMPESFVNQAAARCSVFGSKLFFNCNPDSPRHWFKTNWIDKADEKGLVYLHFTMDDNLSLASSIKERYKSMYDGVFYKRYIEGLWCVAEGIVYSMFDPEKHVVSEHMGGVTEWVVSIDYGTVNPFSAGLWAFNGRYAQREDELYYDSRKTGVRVDDEAYYQMLEKLIDGRKVTTIIIDPSAASFIETIKKHGKYTVSGANNDVLDGIRVTTTMLVKGIFKIHANCKSCISEFGLYCWDDKSVEDKVVKENDHAVDEVRYFCKTFLQRRLRWNY